MSSFPEMQAKGELMFDNPVSLPRRGSNKCRLQSPGYLICSRSSVPKCVSILFAVNLESSVYKKFNYHCIENRLLK